jgi:hypothetical protein
MSRSILSIPVLVLALLGASGCDGDGATGRADGRPPPDARVFDAGASDAALPPDGGAPEAGDGCALAATEEWIGTASGHTVGGSGDDSSVADLRWTRASTEGCVDRYVPSGTATFVLDGRGCFSPDHWIIKPASAPIEPGDGVLVIDRTARPATYWMQGRSTWVATIRCSDDPDPPGNPHEIGGPWADGGGSFDGAAFGASMHRPGGWVTWAMFAADAVFTPPGEACSEPASERWASVAYERILGGTVVAIATWTRVSTTGCVDRYAPSGVAEKRMEDTETCRPLTYDPGLLERRDGALIIDRSTDPATYGIGDYTQWNSTRRCMLPDGTVEATVEQASGLWEAAHGVFDGDRFGAEVFRYRWEIERLASE